MQVPREGMMAVVRNRRGMITEVRPFDADERGRWHLVEVEYADGLGVESEQVLWEVEQGTDVLEPSALPSVEDAPPMDLREFDAMVRAARWSALTPSLPFSGLPQDRPPLAAPLYGAIHPEAYQLVPVLRALEMPRVALMLADAVGLGKTIQAGMVMRELMLRRRIRRILVLCPAALRTQWCEEMDEKFSLPFEVVDRPQTLRLQREQGLDANPWRVHERIIASYHYLKQPDVLEQFRTTAEPGENGRLKWDLLVVDEVHNLAPASFGVDSDLSKMLQQISPWFEHRLFLTATPHNGHTRCFSGLLEMLDPVRFTRKSELDAQDRSRVGEAVMRRLKSEINGSYQARGEPARFSDRIVQALPPLRYAPAEAALHEAFRAFRPALRARMAGAGHLDKMAGAFALEVLQKRLMSGPWAFGQSWLALREGLEDAPAEADAVEQVKAVSIEDTDDDAERETRQRHAGRTVGAWLRRWKEPLAAELNVVSRAVEGIRVERIPPGLEPALRQEAVARAAPRVVADARLDALVKLIDSRLRTGGGWRTDERLVVFTEYLATLDYLRTRLQARYGTGGWLLTLFGGMPDVERSRLKRAFNDPRDPARILLATDAAGEGLNLQRCARLLLHWDIPWNPGRMEQRNGRLDRHGQERDVEVFHFDSDDDTSLRFLGKVLKKRSQTREDQVVTDDLFADAILAHFEEEGDDLRSDRRLDSAIELARREKRQTATDLPEGSPLPGEDDQRRLEHLKAELDLSPASLRETLETALAIEAGRPRLADDGNGRDRLVPPVPPLWQEVVDHVLRKDGPTGPMLALVFDSAHYIKNRSGRPVYIPEPDSRLLHLGDTLYHKVMSTFARYRFPGSGKSATRWSVRAGPVPAGADALLLLTVEEMAVNELREPCHHWVYTLALPVCGRRLGKPLPHEPASTWSSLPSPGDVGRARDLWDAVEDDLKTLADDLAGRRTAEVKSRLSNALLAVREQEQAFFESVTREIERERARVAAQVRRDVEHLQRDAETTMFADDRERLRARIVEAEAEITRRQTHFTERLAFLRADRDRILRKVLPHRYALHGEARVWPVAVEIRLPGGAA